MNFYILVYIHFPSKRWLRTNSPNILEIDEKVYIQKTLNKEIIIPFIFNHSFSLQTKTYSKKFQINYFSLSTSSEML